MQSDQYFHNSKGIVPRANHVGNDYVDMSTPDASDAFLPYERQLTSFHGVEFQPSEICPKNYIIFNHTDYQSQVMFHPALAHRFSCQEVSSQENYGELNTGFPPEDDSDGIDALLSLEEDDRQEQEYEESDDEISTAGTHGNIGCESPDSFSNYCSNPRKVRSSDHRSYNSGNNFSSEKKRLKMKKMVQSLRGIVPGGSGMNTATVLDETVKYLKSLKFEAQNRE